MHNTFGRLPRQTPPQATLEWPLRDILLLKTFEAMLGLLRAIQRLV